MSGNGVENVPSGAKWTTGFPKAILDVPGFKGCCGGFLKFSYVVSAPLHMKGFFEFWESSRASWADRIAVTIDLLVHLALWFVALALEIWVNTQSHKGHALLSELAMSSLWALIVALIGIAIAQIFAMTAGGQEAGRLFPTTYGAIVGGAYASIAFSILWASPRSRSGPSSPSSTWTPPVWTTPSRSSATWCCGPCRSSSLRS